MLCPEFKPSFRIFLLVCRMKRYWVKMPVLMNILFPKGLIWSMPDDGAPAVYLTFDDGPHPQVTPFVIEQLEKYNATATFFCLGKNVAAYPDVYAQLLSKGHTVGNHTNNHVNGWKVSDDVYLQNIEEAGTGIQSRLFRPPYGKIKRSQARKLLSSVPPWKIYMWDVLSGDFDVDISPEKCLTNVVKHIKPGAIVVFHDSAKAWPRMGYALQGVLDYCKKQGWEMRGLPK